MHSEEGGGEGVSLTTSQRLLYLLVKPLGEIKFDASGGLFISPFKLSLNLLGVIHFYCITYQALNVRISTSVSGLFYVYVPH